MKKMIAILTVVCLFVGCEKKVETVIVDTAKVDTVKIDSTKKDTAKKDSGKVK